MSKKLKILIIIIVLVLIVPFGYKQYINKTIISNINNLNNKGFLVVKVADNSGYITTRQSYKLTVSNPITIYNEFLSKMFKKTQKPIIKNIISALNGSEVTVDLNILNFPVSHKNAVNIYLTSLPEKIKHNTNSNLLLQEISTFLKNKGLGESISINALEKITSIKLKNIDKLFNTKKANLKIKIKDYITNIKKFDIKNDNYSFTTKNALFDFSIVTKNGKSLNIGYNNLKCVANRKNLYENQLFCSLDNFNLETQKYKKQILKLNNIFISSISKLKQNKINYQYKYKIKNTFFETFTKYGGKNSINLKDFEYSGNIRDINKNIIDRLSKISYDNSKFYLNKQYQKIILKLINNGFIFNITNFGVASIKIQSKNKNISLGNIKIMMNVKVLKNNIKLSRRVNPLIFLQYLNINLHIELQKKDWDFIQSLNKRKKIGKIGKLVKFNGDKAIFDIKFFNKKLTINNRKIF